MSDCKKSVAERIVKRLDEFAEALEARSDDEATLGDYRVTQRVVVEPDALIRQEWAGES